MYYIIDKNGGVLASSTDASKLKLLLHDAKQQAIENKELEEFTKKEYEIIKGE